MSGGLSSFWETHAEVALGVSPQPRLRRTLQLGTPDKSALFASAETESLT